MPNYSNVDAAFRALSDPVRRAMVVALSNGPQPVKALAEPHKLKLPTVLQHLSVLEAGGIISTEKIGRVRMVRLDGEGLRTAETWLADRRAMWANRLDQLDHHLKFDREDES